MLKDDQKNVIQLYLWLVISLVFFSFSNGNCISIAPWVALVFFMRFMRNVQSKKGIFIAVTGLCLSQVIALYGPFSNNSIAPVMRIIYGGLFGLALVLPSFLVDRFLYKKLRGFVGTLVFPATYVMIEYINSLISPFATFGLIAYTQYNNLVLIQTASLFGIWGLAFLITWTASVVNHAWEHRLQWQKIKVPAIAYISIMIIALSFGGMRLQNQRNDQTVKAALSTLSYDFYPRFNRALKNGVAPSLKENIKTFDIFFNSISRTDAVLAVWSEYALFVNESDVNRLLAHVSQKVKSRAIYCTLPIGIVHKNDGTHRMINIVYLFDPRGMIQTEYIKTYTAPWETSINKEKKIPNVQTDIAKLSLSICFDMDFPSLIRQAGKNNSGVMIVPSHDWRGIVPFHSHMAVFRAIENGFSLFRATGNGLSIATDPCGRITGALDNLTSKSKLMTAEVPTAGVTTLYSKIGDIFARICVLFIGALLLYMIINAVYRDK